MQAYPLSEPPSLALSYDAMCIWFINLFCWWTLNYPELLFMLLAVIVVIPAVHVCGHQESCWYLYRGTYMNCVRHFFGETVEYVWTYLNQLLGQTRQMTLGHRQDTMIQYIGEWNWRKVQQMGETPTLTRFLYECNCLL
jgi:hypothetical protein